MAETDESGTDFSQYKHPVVRATENPSPESFDNLSKAEAIYALAHFAGTDAPEGHPDDHNGNVTRSMVFDLLHAVADVEPLSEQETDGDN